MSRKVKSRIWSSGCLKQSNQLQELLGTVGLIQPDRVFKGTIGGLGGGGGRGGRGDGSCSWG